MAKYRCAILDDFQNVALKTADWSKVTGDVEFKAFNEHLGGPDNVVKALQDYEIVVAMRERTAFPRAVIEKLPKLKLLITTGMRNASIDMAAAAEKGVTVCGTGSFGSPTSGIAIGLMLELTRHIGYENARLKAGRNLAGHHRPGARRAHARHPRPRQARHPHRHDRQGLRHEGDRLEHQPHA